MDIQLLREWKNRLAPMLRGVKGFNGLALNGTTLQVQLSEDSETAKQAVMDIFEKAGADMIPYKVVITGRIRKLEEVE